LTLAPMLVKGKKRVSDPRNTRKKNGGGDSAKHSDTLWQDIKRERKKFGSEKTKTID